MARILVVDDEPGVARLVQTVLETEGHEVLVAERGDRGYELLQREAIDLVVLDLLMPGHSGWELLERLRGHRRPPIAVLSAVFQEGAMRRAREIYGVEAYLTKPFQVERFLDTVSSLLAASRDGDA